MGQKDVCDNRNCTYKEMASFCETLEEGGMNWVCGEHLLRNESSWHFPFDDGEQGRCFKDNE